MANINQSNKDNLFKAFGSFIEAFRAYVVSTLLKEAGDKIKNAINKPFPLSSSEGLKKTLNSFKIDAQ